MTWDKGKVELNYKWRKSDSLRREITIEILQKRKNFSIYDKSQIYKWVR